MRYAKIGFIVILVVIIAGCDKEVAVDEDKIEPIVVEAGKTFIISLESGPAGDIHGRRNLIQHFLS